MALERAGKELEKGGLVLEDLAEAVHKLGHPDHGPDCRVVEKLGGAALSLWSARPTVEVALPESAVPAADAIATRLAELLADAAEAGTGLAVKLDRSDGDPETRLMAGLAGGRLRALWAGPPGDAGVLASALRRALAQVL